MMQQTDLFLFSLSSDLPTYIHQIEAGQRFINVELGANTSSFDSTRFNFEAARDCNYVKHSKTCEQLQSFNTRGSEINGNFLA